MKKLGLSEKWSNVKKWQKRVVIAALVVIVVLLISLPGGGGGQRMAGATFQAKETYDDSRYVSYISQHRSAGYNGQVIQVDLTKDLVTGHEEVLATREYEGRNTLFTLDSGSVTWNIDVKQAGLYTIKIDYYTADGYGGNIERNLYIDGEYPFDEAEGVEFSRVYVDAVPNPSGLLNRPDQEEKNSWVSAYVTDAMGYYAPALSFYLTEGKHTLTFESVKEPMAIASVTLASEDVMPVSYAEALAANNAAGAQDVAGALQDGLIIIQAENTLEKSSPTLYAKADTTSTKNQPYSYTQKLLNTVGGTSWQYANQWITWECEVPVSGYYNIGVRAMQNFSLGLYCNRSLYIDGELPFEEAGNVHFYLSDDWQTFSFGQEGEEPWRFYLEAGTHTLTLKNTMGDLVGILTEADSILESLSAINLELLSILSITPDTDRDYQIALYLPDTLKELKEDEARLQSICDAMMAMTGERGSLTSQLEQLIDIVNRMHTRPNQIAGNYSRYRDLVGGFGEWINNARIQPLLLDYLYVAEVGTKVKSANDNILNALASQVMGFVTSFTNDYSVLSTVDSDTDTGNSITVWIGSGLTGGRDQAMALNQMIVDGFTKETGIHVNLQLVPASTLKNAVFAGRGPDLALQVDQVEPVDFAVRGAAYDLTQFDDFEEVAKRFPASAVDPFEYNGGIYAMPETMSFPMLFYRTDIMEDLGIDVSSLRTWKGIVEILPTLQAQNMDFALPSAISNDVSAGMQSFSMFLYQMDGDFYTPKHTASALSSKTALDAFEYWTDFYMLYGLATDYSFENRFRTGEMPIGIAEYTTYNLLTISAPEIKGKWAMSTLPGTVKADGTVDNVAPIIMKGCLMLQDCKNKDAAWEFIKWWTSAESQYEFGEQLEAVMGAAARYNTANTEALLRFTWSGADRRSIEEQVQNLRGMPQVPGGYYTARYLNFAKLAVINDKENPRSALLDNSADIDEEIKIKRNEFGLEMEE